MTQETQKFLDAEKSAENLVKTLTDLERETSSYATATRELDQVRQKLLDLILVTQNIAKLTLEAVVVMKSIGGPEILARITTLTKQIEAQEKANLDHRNNSKALIISVLVISIISLIVGFVKLFR